MGFDRGAVSMRMFYLPRRLPDDYLARFAAHAAPPRDATPGADSCGWVSGRHLLDIAIHEATCLFAGTLKMSLQQTEYKASASLVQAECRMEELAVLAAEGRAYLKAPERAEIRKEVSERLVRNASPQIKGIPFVMDPGATSLYAQALSVKQCDLFGARFLTAQGFQIMPVTPDFAAFQFAKSDPRSWRPTSFSPRVPDEAMEVEPGADFLTWLLWISAGGDGRVETGAGPIDVLVEGPLTFYHEGRGAAEVIVRKGEAVQSPEAAAALREGKKLRKAKVSVAQGESVYRVQLDADEFVFRALALPESDEPMDPLTLFQERMIHVDRFREIWLALYGSFVRRRADAPVWKRDRDAARAWIDARGGGNSSPAE
jgi:hypothetical protein